MRSRLRSCEATNLQRSFEVGEVDSSAEHPLGGARQEQVAAPFLADRKGTSGHLHVHRAAGDLHVDEHRRHRSGTRAGSQRVARSTLPDLDPGVPPIQHLGQLNVRAVRKQLVPLEQSSQLQAALPSDGLAEYHAVGVAQVDKAARGAARGGVDDDEPVRVETWAPDVKLADDCRPADGYHSDRVAPIARVELEALLGMVPEHGMTGGDAQSVSAPFGLRAVWIEDPHGALSRVEGKQAVGTDSVVTVADLGQQRYDLPQLRGQVEHQIVVAERLVLGDLDDAHDHTLSQPVLCDARWPAQIQSSGCGPRSRSPRSA